MNLGYACINIGLAEKGISTNRGMIKKTFEAKGLQYASVLALNNVQSLLQIVKWNLEQQISIFRVTSELFPWASEYKLESLPDFGEIRTTLEAIGKMPIRLTTHPGPFNKMASEGGVFKNTVIDLEHHSHFFDLMQLPPSHFNKINIHVGGAYGDKVESIKRFASNFKHLSQNLQKRLTVENDDKGGLYTIENLYQLHELIGIPIVFDYFHHKLHPGTLSEEEAFHKAYKTWKVKPVFHYSSSRKEKEDPTAKREAHSDWVHEKINNYGKEVDIILETKMKELSLKKYVADFS